MKNNNDYSEIVNDLKKANFDPSVYSELYTDQDRSEYLIKASAGIMFRNIFKEDVSAEKSYLDSVNIDHVKQCFGFMENGDSYLYALRYEIHELVERIKAFSE